MSSPAKRIQIENLLLAALPQVELKRLQPHLEPLHVPQSTIIYFADDPLQYAYFPNNGMFSLLSSTTDGSTIEVGMVGNEGVIGLPILLRINMMPYEVMAQVTSDVFRVRTKVLREELDRGGQLQIMMLRYTHVLLTQVTQAAVCNHFHSVSKRLCRWLLIARDRVNSDTLTLTQDVISHMLGIPRTGVTMAAGELQKAGLIRYSRGKIVILNHEDLKAAACECYEIIRQEGDHYLNEY